MHRNYNARWIKSVIRQIDIEELRRTLIEVGLDIREPTRNFYLERNEDGEFLIHEPTTTRIISLEEYASPKYGWTQGEKYKRNKSKKK